MVNERVFFNMNVLEDLRCVDEHTLYIWSDTN